MTTIRSKGNQWVMISIVAAAAFFFVFSGIEEAQAKQPVLSYGSEQGYVHDLQYRLYQLGYYKADRDGIFGKLTQNAVIRFQQDYGLRVDGIVGSQTWGALYRQTYTREEINLLTHLVFAEAKGEPYVGQVAVADVTLNRVASPLFPDSVSGVIFEPLAFQCVANGTIWQQPDHTARKAVIDAIRGWNPANGALYFFNPVTSTSDWIWSTEKIRGIGNHIFAI